MRVVQPIGERGSLKWIQRSIAESWCSLNEPLLAKLPSATRIDWLSPLAKDEYAEYRDAAFLKLLKLDHLVGQLAGFWPLRGPQWDALARTDARHVVLVE